MFVLKKIGPVRIGTQLHRFLIGDKLPDVIKEHFKKTRQLESLKEAGVIGDKVDESIRPSESRQPGHSNETGRLELGDDSKERSGDSKPGTGKRSSN